MLDMRVWNKLWPKPPRFALPRLSLLLDSPQSSLLFYTKLDVSNFFWSLRLPTEVHGCFPLSAGARTFGSRRLPFGWSWSPNLAQLTLDRFLSPFTFRPALIFFQYLDDILLASPDPYFLTYATNYCIYLISRSNLSLNKKSVLIPCRSIDWLGKHISSGTISNSFSRIAYALLHLWSLRCCQLSFRRLQRLLGFLQWLLSPSSLSAPFMSSSYQLLQQAHLPTLLPRHIWFSLLVSCLSAARPLTCRALPPPVCMPLMFCDAAPLPSGFMAACLRPLSFALAVPTPSWVRSQQTAELYSVFCCLRQAVLSGLSHVCVVVDNEAAYHTVKSGKVSGSVWARVRLLRRINRLCLAHNLHVQLALTASKHNPADHFSRYLSLPPLDPPFLAAVHSLSPQLRLPTSAITRFWWFTHM